MSMGPTVESPFGGRKVVDVDTHYSEPFDLWTKRAPAKYRSRVPQVVEVDGRPCWIIDETHSIGYGASSSSAIRKDGTRAELGGTSGISFADAHPSCFDAKARVAVMDACGISAQIAYPNLLGFGSKSANEVDPEIRSISMQIYNDAMAELQEESSQRIFPMALVPWWDCQGMVEETRRAHGMGLRGVTINPEPFEHVGADGRPLPDLGDRHWDPFWEVCQSLDMPVNFHIGASATSIDWGASRGWASAPPFVRTAVGGTLLFFSNASTMGNLVFSGVLDRYPKLNFVSVESGLGWIPFAMETWDYQITQASFKLKRLPSEYVRSNIHSSFWYERDNLCRDIRKVGVDNVMFETDFPHPGGLWPIGDVASAFIGMEEIEIAKVLSGNAIRVYNLPI